MLPYKFWGNVQFIGETLPKFWQKVSVFSKWPGIGVMSGIPKGSSRILGKFGAGPFILLMVLISLQPILLMVLISLQSSLLRLISLIIHQALPISLFLAVEALSMVDSIITIATEEVFHHGFLLLQDHRPSLSAKSAIREDIRHQTKGHIALNCYHRANFAYQGAPPPHSIQAMAANMSYTPNDLWIADSGASHHMTPNVHQLQASAPYSSEDKITIGNGEGQATHRILYKGQSDKGLYPIPQVHPQPSQIHKSPLDSSISVIANKDAAKDKASSLPPTQGNSRPHALLGQQVKTKLWHLRLGHSSNDVLHHMLKVSNIPLSVDSTTEMCDSCLQGKMHKLPFSSSSTTSLRPFTKLHTDVWGPSNVAALGGYRYFLTIIDDCTRYMWCILCCVPIMLTSLNQDLINVSTQNQNQSSLSTSTSQSPPVAVILASMPQHLHPHLSTIRSSTSFESASSLMDNSGPLPAQVHPASSMNNHPMQTRSKSEPDTPSYFKQALGHPAWKQAMTEEIQALDQQGTWTLVPSPPNTNIVGCKWIFKIKKNADGTISRYKARLVAQGFSQEYGLDYEETFSPVVRHTTVRLILVGITAAGCEKCFSHGELQEEVFMKQPQGFVDSQYPNHVCKLQKSLYGLKQAPRAWNAKFTGYLPTLGFSVSHSDPSLFVKKTEVAVVILLLYVDDIIITGSDPSLVTSVIQALSEVFELKDLGKLKYFLGLEVQYHSGGKYLSIKPNMLEISSKRHLWNMYLQGTLQFGVTFSPGSMVLSGYCDADWAGDPNTRRSTTGYVVFLGSNPISWSSKKQASVSRSSTEAEYRALAHCAADISWIRQVLCDLHMIVPEAPLLHSDNLSALALSANPVFHSRIKHLDVDFHFIRERVQSKDLIVNMFLQMNRYKFWGNVQFIGRLCRNFGRKSRSLVSGPGIGVMSGIPKGSSQILGKFGAGPFSWYQSSRFNFLWTLHIMCILKLWGLKWVPSRMAPCDVESAWAKDRVLITCLWDLPLPEHVANFRLCV
ncbi:hypothetical protein Prudu_017933 [Prunus dulcis]|uniref:Transposable element protein n=1 Tax=Prunus dulcis TaxID=3755 RepID=A0A4Y1RRD5_PRUDU|nr:hypothetical protein Prudu_017933 [Prunus dulcis]